MTFQVSERECKTIKDCVPVAQMEKREKEERCTFTGDGRFVMFAEQGVEAPPENSLFGPKLKSDLLETEIKKLTRAESMECNMSVEEQICREAGH
jgi:hypothetical protein